MNQINSEVNRRSATRHQPRGGSKIICATGKFGLGPNVAVSVLDVSETGIRLIVKVALPVGGEVEVGLEAPADRKPTPMPAEVVWCVPMADGNFCVGARFARPLKYALLQAFSRF
jgi:hypothetical protein